ncbi:unnamed protein product [Paramecium sonneborni]|uniref:Uncharacterized protein n=1 Tax=Paramecium sonneborni TaxID=65129 RepID=A0A8S1L8F7_9CILI|nr:unnamed protein product [Paramecium sonneborni]
MIKIDLKLIEENVNFRQKIKKKRTQKEKISQQKNLTISKKVTDFRLAQQAKEKANKMRKRYKYNH